MTKKYLTKSLFKLAVDCPAKLFYANNSEYTNNKAEDPFLKALSDGGFQVGELAKAYFPNGKEIVTLDYDSAVEETKRELKRDSVTIYEAAARADTLFARIDILKKDGKHFTLIEVKAKSFDEEENSFLCNNGDIRSGWESYIYDLAFQKFVLQKSYPMFKITSAFLFADKKAICKTEGLNQKLQIIRDESVQRGFRVINSLDDEDTKNKILTLVPADEVIDPLISSEDFQKVIRTFALGFKKNMKIDAPISSSCDKCEFICTQEEEMKGQKSGFKECWKKELGWSDKDFTDSNVLEIWNYRKKDQLIKNGKVKLKDVKQGDISPKASKTAGLSSSERQWLQVKKSQSNDNTSYFDKDGLKNEIRKWRFPLNFIDFETAAVLIST